MPDPRSSNPFALEFSAASVEAIAEAVLVLVDQDLHDLAAARIDEALSRRGGDPETWLSVGEVAEVLGVHQRTIYRALSTGRLAGVRVGSHWRVRRADMDEWLRQQNQRRPLPAASTRPAPPPDSFRHRANQRRAGR